MKFFKGKFNKRKWERGVDKAWFGIVHKGNPYKRYANGKRIDWFNINS